MSARHWVIAMLVLVPFFGVGQAAAHADPTSPGAPPTQAGPAPDVDATGNALVAHGVAHLLGDAEPASSGEAVSGVWHHDPVCAMGGAQTCSELATCDDGSIQMYVWFQPNGGVPQPGTSSCPGDATAAPPVVTPGLVLRALRRIPLPASELVVQPPGGRTLVNFETNFYTEQGEFTRVVRLLGRRVELRIRPETFTWHYGDGASEQTRSAGSPYPDLEITHRYLERGRVAVSVDTTYAADFRVGAGEWRPVAGTVTIPGEAEGLRIVTARPVLVGG